MYDFGARLRAIREQRGMTQKTLANKINRSVSAVSGYELNAQMPPGDILESIACVLNVSLDYLIGFEQNETYSTKGLDEGQKEILNMIFEEFTVPTGEGCVLTRHQIDIIQKLLVYFLTTRN